MIRLEFLEIIEIVFISPLILRGVSIAQHRSASRGAQAPIANGLHDSPLFRCKSSNDTLGWFNITAPSPCRDIFRISASQGRNSIPGNTGVSLYLRLEQLRQHTYYRFCEIRSDLRNSQGVGQKEKLWGVFVRSFPHKSREKFRGRPEGATSSGSRPLRSKE